VYLLFNIVYNPVQYIIQCKPEKFEKTTNLPHISHNVVSSILAMSGIRTTTDQGMMMNCSISKLWIWHPQKYLSKVERE
jgi:hypothetical protein